MDKRIKAGPRRKKKILKRRKQMLMVLFIFIIFLVGSTSFKLLDALRPVAVGVSTEEVLTTMVLNNPLKYGLSNEIAKAQEEKAKAKIEELRTIEREKRKAEEEAERLERKERDKNKKIAYLTFDDGPSINVTPRILNILDDYNIKATFFVLGRMANANPEILQRINKEGHAIGHHSYSHDYNHIYRSTENFIAELNKTNKLFENILGKDFQTRLLRFPGGSFEKSKQKYKSAIEALGYKNYDWNSLNGDAEGHNLSKRTLVNRLKTTVSSRADKSEMIILMHDTDAKSTTADSLPEIIEYLINEGYEFRTLNQK